MKKEDRKLLTTSRRNFARSLLPAALALQLAEVQRVEGQKNKSKHRGKEERQTSPITVGGGGGGRPGDRGPLMVTISFAQSDYKEGNPNEFRNPKAKLEKLWITDHWGKKKHYPVQRSFTIHCIRQGDQNDSQIMVIADPLEIRFDKLEYQYDSDKEVYINYDRKITTVYIDSDQRPAFTATNGICNIDIDDQC